MKFSRHLEPRDFLKEIRDLKFSHDYPSEQTLERLERERILLPRLRLRYPDPIERRWFASEDNRDRPTGRLEPDGARWNDANDLERARQRRRGWPFRDGDDPLLRPHPLDSPKTTWRRFIQYPDRRKFTRWTDFRVDVTGGNGQAWKNRTVVTYYSTWQVLLYIECATMGVYLLGNTEGLTRLDEDVPKSFVRSVSFEPIHSLETFREFRHVLDAVVWFTEEDNLNDNYVLRGATGRRLIEDHEFDDMERRSEALAAQCKARFRITYPRLIALSKALARRWDHWHHIGCTHQAKAYKLFLSRTVELARYLRDVPVERLIADVGQVTGHFKPTLRVIFNDWVVEWRQDAERLLLSFARPDALLFLPVTAEQVGHFLNFVEANDLYEFYWRWRSLNERAFADDSNRLAGLRSDLQSMAVSVEHLVAALLSENVAHPKQALFEKFKQIWPVSTSVGRLLLRTPEYRTNAYTKTMPDLAWFDSKQGTSEEVEAASDLAICHAIRGNAHNQIRETNQLRLERLSLILLRGALRAFIEVRRRWPSQGTD